MMNGINTILWDWNGTLLNDTEICRNIVNDLLIHRNITPLSSDRYKDIFTFPVKDYYQKAGFDFSKEDFEKPADEFIASYNTKIHTAQLHPAAENILRFLKQKSHSQFIVSAMEQNSLDKSINGLGIQSYFEEISGIGDHYATSKTDNAQNLIKKYNLDPQKTCLIGDTIHDHEVSLIINCECILIANGHQSKSRLIETGRIVLDALPELMNYF